MMLLFRVLIILLTVSTNVIATTIQSLGEIKSAASKIIRTHFGERNIDVQITVGNLDQRLTLPACGNELESFLPPGSNDINISTVGVRCNEGTAWTVYVPVDIQFNHLVVVTTHGVSKGSVLSVDDIITSQRRARVLPNDLTTRLDQAIGKELLRNLPPGATIPVSALRAPTAIRRGDSVQVRVGNDDLQVLVTGIALASGAVGDVIKVKNTRTERVLVGTVRGPGEVEVGM